MKNLPYKIILGRSVMRDQQLVFENSAPTGTPMTPPSANSSTEHTPSELDTRTNQTTVEGRLGTTDTNADSGGQKRKRGPRQKPRRPTLREETPAGPLKRKRITLCVPCNPATLTPAPPVIGGRASRLSWGNPSTMKRGRLTHHSHHVITVQLCRARRGMCTLD